MFAVHKSDLEIWAACTQQLSLPESCLESSSCMLYVASQLASYLATYLILFWLVPSCSQLQRYLNSQSKSTHSIRSCYLTFTWKQAGSNLTQLANNTYLVGLLLMLMDSQLSYLLAIQSSRQFSFGLAINQAVRIASMCVAKPVLSLMFQIKQKRQLATQRGCQGAIALSYPLYCY